MKNIWDANDKLPKDNVFLVGGAVRDIILGQASNDKDYVVLNTSIEKMINLGFKQVGKDFPVFLDPKDGEEYALARIERKNGVGYHGFETITSGVSLEDDLKRRDLTINAIAMDYNGDLVDPYNGKGDIENKILRHVSNAFSEDPLRVLRVARFYARYAHLGFEIAPETKEMMKDIVNRGELDNLTAERVWMEFEKCAQTQTPSKFISALHECGALKVILPEVDALYGVPQAAQYHPEIDTGIHTQMVMDMARVVAPGNVRVLFAALTHDLGKALTPENVLPQHLNHEKNGLDPLEDLIKRLKVPNDSAKLARVVCEHHLGCHRALESRTGTILSLIEKIDGFRNETRFEEFLLACEADKRGRLGMEMTDYKQAQLLRRCFLAAKSVSGQQFVDKGMSGLDIKQAIRDERLRLIKREQIEFKQEQKEIKDNAENNLNNLSIKNKKPGF